MMPPKIHNILSSAKGKASQTMNWQDQVLNWELNRQYKICLLDLMHKDVETVFKLQGFKVCCYERESEVCSD
jgi:hypothetical protein